MKYKDSTDNDPTYWYADFEADVSGNIHKPFMCYMVMESVNRSL